MKLIHDTIQLIYCNKTYTIFIKNKQNKYSSNSDQ